jgi:hypothetical protein
LARSINVDAAVACVLGHGTPDKLGVVVVFSVSIDPFPHTVVQSAMLQVISQEIKKSLPLSEGSCSGQLAELGADEEEYSATRSLGIKLKG